MAADPVRVVDMTAEAEAILDSCEALALGVGIAMIEGVSEVTKPVLECLGFGSPSGLRLADLTSPDTMATHRSEYVVALLTADTELWDIYGDSSSGADEHTRTAHLAVARLVAAVVEKVKAANVPTPANETKGSAAVTSYVVTQSEEDRAFSFEGYTMADTTRLRDVLVKLHNIKVRPFYTPKIGVMKNIAYWLKVEFCWPDKNRLKMEKFKHEPTDTPLVIFKRMVYGIMIILAGEKVPAG